jgi:hypothetical protein
LGTLRDAWVVASSFIPERGDRVRRPGIRESFSARALEAAQFEQPITQVGSAI